MRLCKKNTRGASLHGFRVWGNPPAGAYGSLQTPISPAAFWLQFFRPFAVETGIGVVESGARREARQRLTRAGNGFARRRTQMLGHASEAMQGIYTHLSGVDAQGARDEIRRLVPEF